MALVVRVEFRMLRAMRINQALERQPSSMQATSGSDQFGSISRNAVSVPRRNPKLVKLCRSQRIDKNGIDNTFTDAEVLVFVIRPYVVVALLLGEVFAC